nr:hypothetical protein Iba_chr05fCG5380 [Ipomoea batatas]GMD01224.1 hypothetical protein Iba_chr05fCG5400 [Ipomoea batatas]
MSFIYIASDGWRRMTNSFLPRFLHLNISPGTSLNWTRISAFLELSAFPALSIKGTPATSSLCMRRTMVAKVGVFELSGTVGSSL